ncbi:hypothetical protein K435DRAFT_804292 [Dendrothele bispora CBS 962.96]|uniref:Uncharacterized protein n=1 Tax=Dendrothele bispora (strain CBS 962.96) TaxID=1314807 RepID=A0A4V4HDJ2_DENBC|nr:hypothetical protein K435DRAFT_804292 [Dendrothele bispora CBS 962.96]
MAIQPKPLHIETHLPLITPRIEFRLFSARALPQIAPRIDFGCFLQETETQSAEQSRPSNNNAGDKTHSSASSAKHSKETPPTIQPPEGYPEEPPTNQPPEEQSHQSEGEESRLEKYNKPVGQPNRPRCGGYNLENKLVNDCGWSKEQFDTVQWPQKQVHKQANELLDTGVSFQYQSTKSVLKLCDKNIESEDE